MDEQNTEKKHKHGRTAFFIIILLIIFGMFTARLADWQLINGSKYNEVAKSSTSYTIETEALRGEILDVNGVGLAVNSTGYQIVIDKLYMEDDKLNDSILSLISLVEKCGDEWIDVLPIVIDGDSYKFANDMEDEVSELKNKDNLNMNTYSTAEECMNKLIETYKCDEYSKKDQRNIISVRYNMNRMGYSKSTPYTFADEISSDTMAIVSENFQDVAGIDVRNSTVRTNPNGTVAAQIVGAYGAISSDEYEEKSDEGYVLNDKIGKFGIEKSYESQLRGKSGSKLIRASSNGNVLDVVETQNAEPGNTVYLTIDTNYQLLAQQALEDATKEAQALAKQTGTKNSGEDCISGSVVMLDVKDFSVICAATYPTYDLSKYWEDYSEIAATEGDPLINRAFQSAFTPGSTFKPLIASAALEEKAINKNTKISCTGVYDYYQGLRINCMSVHNSINVTEAIAVSCNYFFNDLGRVLGIESIENYAKRVGFGSPTGIELCEGEETSGAIAGPENSKSWGTEWYPGNTVQAAIGQSDTLISPVQLATYAATLANNGTRLQTHIVRKVVSYDRKTVISENDPDNPTVVDNMGVSQENLDIVKEGMIKAVNETYSSVFGDFEIQVVGKTGTAENNGSDHANFICYAPADNPQVAIGVMIEHGAKSTVAMNVAKKLLTQYFKDNPISSTKTTSKS